MSTPTAAESLAPAPPYLPCGECTAFPETELPGLKTWYRPIDERMWAVVQRQRTMLRYIEPQITEPADRLLLEDCLHLNDVALACIDPRRRALSEDERAHFNERHAKAPRSIRPWPFCENNTLYRELVHQVDEELLMILPLPILLSWAREVELAVDLNVKPPAERERWLGKLHHPGLVPKAIQALEAMPQEARGIRSEEEQKHRAALRSALQWVNTRSDRAFREVAVSALMRTWSGALLLSLLAALFVFLPLTAAIPHETPDLAAPGALAIVLLGALGAVVANLLSKKPFEVSLGPTRRYFLLYLVFRPLLAGFAGVFSYFLLRSQLLFDIVVTKPEGTQAAAGLDGLTSSLLVIPVATAQAWTYAVAVMVVCIGYGTEHFLGPTMDRVLCRLLRAADKQQETPALPNPAPQAAS